MPSFSPLTATPAVAAVIPAAMPVTARHSGRTGPPGGRGRRHELAGLFAGLVLLAAPLLLPAVLLAQHRSTPGATVSGPPAEPVTHAGIEVDPADTGRMALGWQEFSRYQWMGPGAMCEAAVEQAFSRVWRHGEHDTASYAARVRDSTPPAVRAIAERCGAPTLAAGLAQLRAGAGGWRLFYPLLRVALVLGQDTTAQALIRAYLSHAGPSDSAAMALGRVLGDELQAHPFRPALLEDYITLTDSVARLPGASVRLWTDHLEGLAARWEHYLRLGDTARVRSTAEPYLAAYDRVPKQALNYVRRGDVRRDAVYDALLRLTILEHGVHSPDVIAVLQRIDRAKGGAWSSFRVPILQLYGKPLVYPAAPYWYAAAGAPVTAGATDTGHVTLVWSPSAAADDDHTCPMSREANEESCYPVWGFLKKLMARYGPQGLRLVVLENTRGFTLGGGGVDPEQEAPSIRQFYQEQLQLPAVVAVDTTPYVMRAAPDGRRANGCTAWQKRYVLFGLPCQTRVPAPMYAPPNLWLLDRHGQIRSIGFSGDRSGVGVTEDALLELAIQHVLQGSP